MPTYKVRLLHERLVADKGSKALHFDSLSGMLIYCFHLSHYEGKQSGEMLNFLPVFRAFVDKNKHLFYSRVCFPSNIKQHLDILDDIFGFSKTNCAIFPLWLYSALLNHFIASGCEKDIRGRQPCEMLSFSLFPVLSLHRKQQK